MSWMDSWSRPSKSQPTPPPLYLTSATPVPYCHSCGRVIGQRKSTHNNHAGATEVKYCSARCRNNKPGPVDRRIERAFAALLDGRAHEEVKGEFGETRDDEEKKQQEQSVVPKGKPFPNSRKGHEDADAGSKAKKGASKKKKHVKGDPRITVECSFVEDLLFPKHKDPEKVYGRRKNRKARGIVERPEDWRSVDMVDDPEPKISSTTAAAAGAAVTPGAPASQHRHDKTASDTLSESASEVESDSDSEDAGGIALETKPPTTSEPAYGFGSGKVRPPQDQSDVNGAIGGEKGRAERIEETDEMKLKRREGQRRADEREMVRKAARRLVAFGAPDDGNGDGDGERRKCEAVMKGAVVEGSFAKGEWGIRWREKV